MIRLTPRQLVNLNAGDYLVMFTDGVTDAQIGNAQPFGEERLKATIRKTFREKRPGDDRSARKGNMRIFR